MRWAENETIETITGLSDDVNDLMPSTLIFLIAVVCFRQSSSGYVSPVTHWIGHDAPHDRSARRTRWFHQPSQSVTGSHHRAILFLAAVTSGTTCGVNLPMAAGLQATGWHLDDRGCWVGSRSFQFHSQVFTSSPGLNMIVLSSE